MAVALNAPFPLSITVNSTPKSTLVQSRPPSVQSNPVTRSQSVQWFSCESSPPSHPAHPRLRPVQRVLISVPSSASSHASPCSFSSGHLATVSLPSSTSFNSNSPTQEIYRITAGLGGLGTASDLCIWSLLALRCGTIVSGDSSGTVQFWDGQFGTLLQVHSYHKGDVNALAAAPSHNRVFSASFDGQVILYKLSSEVIGSDNGKSFPEAIKKWIYVGYKRAHTHDVRSLTVAVPISHEDLPPDERVKMSGGQEKHLDFSYHKWTHLGVPMLISAGDDTKLLHLLLKSLPSFLHMIYAQHLRECPCNLRGEHFSIRHHCY